MSVNSFNASNPPLTTKGDLFTFSTIPTRIGVGANDTVLTADSSTATGLKWAAAGAAPANFSLLNAGGTTLTTATTTISGISGKTSLCIVVENATSNTANSFIAMKPNGTATNGRFCMMIINNSGAPATQIDSGAQWGFGHTGNSTANTLTGSVWIFGANSTGTKVLNGVGGGNSAAGGISRAGNGIWPITSAITSIDIVNFGGNFTGGTVFVYGSDN